MVKPRTARNVFLPFIPPPNLIYDRSEYSIKAFIVVLLVAIAAYLGYRIVTKPKPAPPTIAESQPVEPTSAPPVAVQEKAATQTNLTTKAAAQTNKAMTARASDLATPKKSTGEWKAKMQTILGANTGAEQKIHDLKEMLSKLDEAESEERRYRAAPAATTITRTAAAAVTRPKRERLR